MFTRLISRTFLPPKSAPLDMQQWREQVLSAVLFAVLVLGGITAVPSILLALSEGLPSIAVMDAAALIWLACIWRLRRLPYRVRAINFLGLLYLVGAWFQIMGVPVSQIYLKAVPIMAALLLGMRPAVYALVLDAMTMLCIGYIGNAGQFGSGLPDQPFLRWVIITLNFSFVCTAITISCAVLLQKLEKSLEAQRAISESLKQGQESLRVANEELRLTAAAVERLNDLVLITEAQPISLDGPRIVFVNDAFVRRTGYTREEVLGKTPRLLQGPNTQRHELKRIRMALEKWEPVRAELINYTKGGEEFWVEADIVPIADDAGVFTHWVAVERDITERKKSEARIHKLAFFDVLTGLPNRRLLLDRISTLLSSARRTGLVSAVLFIDLDHFKNINEARGHAVGDALLRHVARRLGNLLREMDTVARIGGDEFVVLVSNIASDIQAGAHAALAVAEKIRDAMDQPFVIDGQPYSSGGTIGVTLLPKTGQSADDLLREADTAMNRAKSAGRNQIAFFESAMQFEVEQRLTIERDMAEAVGGDQFEMYLQSQVNCDGDAVGGEMLMRWFHPVRGPVSPAVFIPVAEESGLILKLGEWALRQGCQTLVRLVQAGRAMPVSINVSPKQFRQADFVDQVCAVLAETGAPASLLILEVTEGLLIDNLDDTIARMHQLTAMGVRFSIDDFGTGYSSLAYLKKLPLYELKIDKSFVRDAPGDPGDAAIVQAIVSMAKPLGLRVVAEGVETRQQADFLVASGCDCLQGFLFAKPMPVDEWLSQKREHAETLRI
ncbi:EAL domain-containing protein [Undibacterium sp.]|uniref:EAL domain-containing protein n=1 Tax=Undibacterium sp. TaxID=1914977 RepID=UPI00374DC81F